MSTPAVSYSVPFELRDAYDLQDLLAQLNAAELHAILRGECPDGKGILRIRRGKTVAFSVDNKPRAHQHLARFWPRRVEVTLCTVRPHTLLGQLVAPVLRPFRAKVRRWQSDYLESAASRFTSPAAPLGNQWG